MKKSFIPVMLMAQAIFFMASCVNTDPTPPPPDNNTDTSTSNTITKTAAEDNILGALQVITLAGNGTPGLVNNQGTSAQFNNPTAITMDKAGNKYVADRSNHVIRKISPLGAVTTLAGSGTAGVATGTGTAAQFNNPSGVAVDASGNIYVADRLNHAIRKISPAGAVSNFAGIPNPSGAGSTDGPGTSAKFNNPTGVAIDTGGNVYVADAGNNKIRKITPAGFVSTLAGSGTRGGGNGPGAFAQFNAPWSVAVTASGIVFVADSGNHKIRKIVGSTINTSTVSTLAGGGSTGAAPGFVDASGTAALFNSPTGITIDTSGNLWVADKSNHAIRKITAAGEVSTLGGNGTAGFADGVPSVARFSSPFGVAVDTSGNIFVADQDNQRIREMGVFVVVTTLAGNGIGAYLDGPALSAEFQYTWGVAPDGFGNVYVADYWNLRIRKIAGGSVSTLAGNGTRGYADGAGSAALFDNPTDVATDASGNVYVVDQGNQRIRKITPSGVVTTVAGNSTLGLVNGVGPAAQFRNPNGLTVDASGNIYVADEYNHAIRKVTPSGVVTTLAGNGTAGFVNGPGSSARFAHPKDVAVDAAGNVYVADAGNSCIRKIAPDGTVSTWAGTNQGGYVDGPASTARFASPFGIAIDASGNVYVADMSIHRIRKITPSGVVSTLAGSGSTVQWQGGFVDGPSNVAQFKSPINVGVGPDGKVYVADYYNQRIRKIQ